jgi:hypothetical protein
MLVRRSRSYASHEFWKYFRDLIAQGIATHLSLAPAFLAVLRFNRCALGHSLNASVVARGAPMQRASLH